MDWGLTPVRPKALEPMPWNVRNTMDLKKEFVALASQEGANRRELCRRFGISSKTGYKWLDRFGQQGATGLAEQSRRPARVSPRRTLPELEDRVIAIREAHPAWGGRKIAARLKALGVDSPAPSTITDILRRHGMLYTFGREPVQHAWQRFEHEAPNVLWQMDFKGDFAVGRARCYPLTVIDDHSRYNLALQGCPRTDSANVRERLTATFQRYGLPLRINTDNGAPFGVAQRARGALTPLMAWLVRLGIGIGIGISHSRPRHPQTNGKNERFHRSMKAEVLARRGFRTMVEAQQAFDCWRHVYNHERPHEGIDMQVPIERYTPSQRSFPPVLPPVEDAYSPDDLILVPDSYGRVRAFEYGFTVSTTLAGQPIAARPHPGKDGIYDLYYCHHRLMRVSMHDQHARA
jgi:transposase InsO family protein